MLHPAYFKAVMYKGSLIPVSSKILDDSNSFGVISAFISPLSTTIILSTLQCKTSSNLCSTINIVLLVFSLICSISSMAFLPVAGSKLAKGSSNNNISTSSTITPANITLCFCPPDNLWGDDSKLPSIPTIFDTILTVSFIFSCGIQSFSSLNAISSPTVNPINWLSGSCSTVPTTFESFAMLISLVSCPFIFRLPFISPLYEKGTRPFIQFDNVLLPDPDGPTIRTFSPSYIVKFILFNVGFAWALYWNEKSLNSITGLFI